MMMRSVRSCWMVLLCCFAARLAAQQDSAPASPSNYAVLLGKNYRPLDAVRRGAVPMPAKLSRRITLSRQRVLLQQALLDIANQAGLGLSYGEDLARSNTVVSIEVSAVRAADALAAVVRGTGWTVFVNPAAQVTVVQADKNDLRAGNIAGQVTDAKTGMALGDVEVFLEKTRWRTMTDTAGRYRLVDVDPGTYTLATRRLGYAKQSRAAVVRDGQTDTVNIVLAPVVARLQELVTTATGQRRRLDIPNDVTTINADSVMQAAPIRSVTDLLATRVPGLTVQRTSGAPGDPARLRLRGVASPLRNNDPIVIVDGVRAYAEQSANRSGNLASKTLTDQSYATPSPLDYIDPNSIETIEVLKGPSAATLYGQDAANGVIVITTKRGRPGPARWTAGVEHGRTQMAGQYPGLFLRLGQYSYGSGPTNCLITNQTLSSVISPSLPCHGDSVVTFQLLSDPELTVLDRGHRTAATLGVSGGSPTVTYAVTGSYQDEVGLIRLPAYEADHYRTQLGLAPPAWMQRPQHLKQWAATSIITAHLGANTDVSLSTSLSRTEQQRSSLEETLGNLMTTYLDRTSGTYYRFGFSTDPFANFAIGPNALGSYYERATATATKFANSANLSYRPRAWLTFTADAGLDVVQRADQVFVPRGPLLYGDTTGYVDDGHGSSVVSTVNLRALALTPIGRGFQFRFAAGVNYNGRSTNDVSGGSKNLAPGSSLQGAEITFLRRAEQSDATFGWYIDPSVGNQKLNVNAGLRLDGGSSYGSNVSGFSLPKFPKLGFSYLISEEPFFPFKNLFQSLRVRVAYGKASRQPGLTDRLRLYSRPTQVFADGQSQTGVMLQQLGNTEVRPEQTAELEGGFDADLLDSRVILSVSGHRKTTEDALLSVPVAPEIYGNGMSIIKNIGVIRNTGLDVVLGTQLVRNGPVTWGTQLQLSQNRNVVVSLGPEVKPFYSDPSIYGGLRVAAGYPLFGRWTKPILGYADANGDGVLQRSEVQLGDTAVYVGSTLPNYTAILSTTVSLWHGAVTVDAGFAYEDGLSQRNEVAQQLGLFSAGQQVPGTALAEQVATMNLSVDGSDYNWIQTVSTTRFNSLAVRYAVPVTVARRLGAQTLSLAVQGANLGLWTNYRGLDPNVNAFGTGNNVTDTGILPQPRTWQLRVQATY